MFAIAHSQSLGVSFRFEFAMLERAVRFELTIPDLQSGALAAWRRAHSGAEGEIRTLEASLEDSNVSSYITSAKTVQPLKRAAGQQE